MCECRCFSAYLFKEFGNDSSKVRISALQMIYEELTELSTSLFCRLFMEFIFLTVRRLRLLRNFHTVLPSGCTSFHSLQPCRRFPDLQASSAFTILLVGSLLIVILTGMRWCIIVALFCISYCLALVSIFHFPLARLKEQVAPPRLSSCGAQA